MMRHHQIVHIFIEIRLVEDSVVSYHDISHEGEKQYIICDCERANQLHAKSDVGPLLEYTPLLLHFLLGEPDEELLADFLGKQSVESEAGFFFFQCKTVDTEIHRGCESMDQ